MDFKVSVENSPDVMDLAPPLYKWMKRLIEETLKEVMVGENKTIIPLLEWYGEPPDKGLLSAPMRSSSTNGPYAQQRGQAAVARMAAHYSRGSVIPAALTPAPSSLLGPMNFTARNGSGPAVAASIHGMVGSSHTETLKGTTTQTRERSHSTGLTDGERRQCRGQNGASISHGSQRRGPGTRGGLTPSSQPSASGRSSYAEPNAGIHSVEEMSEETFVGTDTFSEGATVDTATAHLGNTAGEKVPNGWRRDSGGGYVRKVEQSADAMSLTLKPALNGARAPCPDESFSLSDGVSVRRTGQMASNLSEYLTHPSPAAGAMSPSPQPTSASSSELDMSSGQLKGSSPQQSRLAPSATISASHAIEAAAPVDGDSSVRLSEKAGSSVSAWIAAVMRGVPEWFADSRLSQHTQACEMATSRVTHEAAIASGDVGELNVDVKHISGLAIAEGRSSSSLFVCLAVGEGEEIMGKPLRVPTNHGPDGPHGVQIPVDQHFRLCVHDLLTQRLHLRLMVKDNASEMRVHGAADVSLAEMRINTPLVQAVMLSIMSRQAPATVHFRMSFKLLAASNADAGPRR